MNFDNTISIGTILNLVGMTVLAVSLYYALRNDLREVKMKVDLIWQAWTGGGNGAKSYEVRLSTLEAAMARLEDRLR